ncbi:MAG: hypothetical protein JTT11_06400 [Candidatus Brockarchaeota archaeon]|nr:hypothetical protein [Candidatus Brockarchaeota archaeon]
MELSFQYGKVAKLLGAARKKELPDGGKIKCLDEARKAEGRCLDRVEKLL